MVADKPSYNVKTQIIQDFLKKGSGGGIIPALRFLHVKALSKLNFHVVMSEARES